MPRSLRYAVRCSVGELEEAPSATAPLGYTDDLAVAQWHAEHGPPPGFDVYDVALAQWVSGGGPPEEYRIRDAIQRLIGELTVPGWHLYPYPPVAGDAVGAQTRAMHSAKWLEEYPDWTPVPEYVVGPLRVALYRARGLERQAAESEPPGALAACPDGRDLTEAWRMDGPEFEAWARGFGFSPKPGRPTSDVQAFSAEQESHWRFRERVYAAIPSAFFQ